MSYILNRTDGTILVELVDGILDTDTTDIALVGRNFTGYGEFINENFVKMLENFANSTVPLSPLKGQLWYDTSINKLQIYNGEEFQPAAGSFVGILPPQDPIAGDTWYDTSSNQLYLFDGEDFQLVGPQFTLQQGKSGIFVRTVQDQNLNPRTVLEIRLGETLQAIVSRIQITPGNTFGNIVPELVTTGNPDGIIYPGINVVNPYEFQYRGTAALAQGLITGTNLATEFSTDKVLRNDQRGTVAGDLTLFGDPPEGIVPALQLIDSSVRLFVETQSSNPDTDDVILEVQDQRRNTRLKVFDPGDTATRDAITIDPIAGNLGIFSRDPQFTLDVTGDARITGELTVEGTITTIESTILRVADKNIELGIVPDESSQPSDTTADGGGITLLGNTNKTLNWVNTTSSWTSSENVDLATGKEYRINNTKVIDVDSLGTTITSAPGVTSVGTLTDLTVDDIFIDGSTVTVSTGLTFNANGNISVSSSKITDLVQPEVDTDAANKVYVDEQIDNSLLAFSIDITAWSTAEGDVRTNIRKYLDAVFEPDAVLNDGKQAKIITTRITSTEITGINVEAQSTVTPADVLINLSGDKVSVVQDISLPTDLSVAYTPSVLREVRTFEIVSGAWQYVSGPITVPGIL
jgi:hypothetical protein